MRASRIFTAGLPILALALVAAESLSAQVAMSRLPSWRADSVMARENPTVSARVRSVRRSHAGTGLLIGSALGLAATTVFLVGFCGDADSACGADEVGRAVVVIAIPIAAAGALIGWLVRTEE